MRTKPLTRKRCTVEVKERRRVSYSIGQKVWDRVEYRYGTIETMTAVGALLHRTVATVDGHVEQRWFVYWYNVRPDASAYWL